MPERAPRPCRAIACPQLSTDGTGYCKDHKQESGWFEYSKESRHKRGYGTRWVKLRKLILQRDRNLCQPCKRTGRLTTATEVDHIIPKAKGGNDHQGNLEAICQRCHREKTAQERNN